MMDQSYLEESLANKNFKEIHEISESKFKALHQF